MIREVSPCLPPPFGKELTPTQLLFEWDFRGTTSWPGHALEMNRRREANRQEALTYSTPRPVIRVATLAGATTQGKNGTAKQLSGISYVISP